MKSARQWLKMVINMYKYKNLEEELHSVYKKLTPNRISNLANKKYKQKIKRIKTKKIDKTYEEHQEQIMDNLIEESIPWPFYWVTSVSWKNLH